MAKILCVGEMVIDFLPGSEEASYIRKAGGAATASVIEHALRRGSGANMHMLYLKNHAGYDGEKGGKAARSEDGEQKPPVIFLGEEDIPDSYERTDGSIQ